MSKDGRIIDYERNAVTTSEGQAYMMLKSLALDDKKTFDLVFKWTKNNLQRKDSLFAYLWGGNQTGINKIIDENSASDADIDIAFALILAYEKYDNPQYLEEAIPIIRSIWDNETKYVGNHLVIMPGINQAYSSKVEINPSYFSPYAFRYFQKYDDFHDWNSLIDSSYYYLDLVMSKTKTHLPPNWFLFENNQVVLENSPKSDFSYDAVRVFPRIYLDYSMTGEKRALPILQRTKFFVDKWKAKKATDEVLYINYEANGQLRNKNKFVGGIAVLLPAISLVNPEIANEIYIKELGSYYLDINYWESRTDYYGKNLAWFGCFLYNTASGEYKLMYKYRIKGN